MAPQTPGSPFNTSFPHHYFSSPSGPGISAVGTLASPDPAMYPSPHPGSHFQSSSPPRYVGPPADGASPHPLYVNNSYLPSAIPGPGFHPTPPQHSGMYDARAQYTDTRTRTQYDGTRHAPTSPSVRSVSSGGSRHRSSSSLRSRTSQGYSSSVHRNNLHKSTAATARHVRRMRDEDDNLSDNNLSDNDLSDDDNATSLNVGGSDRDPTKPKYHENVAAAKAARARVQRRQEKKYFAALEGALPISDAKNSKVDLLRRAVAHIEMLETESIKPSTVSNQLTSNLAQWHLADGQASGSTSTYPSF